MEKRMEPEGLGCRLKERKKIIKLMLLLFFIKRDVFSKQRFCLHFLNIPLKLYEIQKVSLSNQIFAVPELIPERQDSFVISHYFASFVICGKNDVTARLLHPF
jgi:hypothetical protein